MSIRIYFGASVGTGTNISAWLMNDGSLQWTKSVNQNWQCTFVLRDLDGTLLALLGARPAVGQPYWITEILSAVETVRFSGLISQVVEQGLQGTHGALLFQITGGGWTTVCDHRIIVAVYDAGQTSLAVITDVYSQTIASDGIAFTEVDGFTLTPQPLTFNPSTVTDAFNQIRTLTQEQWWIDENKGLHFKAQNLGGTNSGVAIDDAHQNIMLQAGPTQMPRVTTSTNNYRNVQYELTSQPVATQSRTETIIIGATDGFFQVVDFPIDTTPIITLNGVTQTIYQFGVDAFGKAGWYWQQGSNTLQQGQQISPGAGVTMVVTYSAFSENFTVDTDAAEVAARAAIEGTSGKWENIDQQASISNADVGHAYGQGQLTNFGVIPKVVVFDSYVSTFDGAIGKYITFNYTLNNLVGQFTITDMSASHVPGLVAPSPATGGAVLYTVTCTNQMYTGNYVQWFLGLTTAVKAAAQAAATAVAIAGNSTGSPPVTPAAGLRSESHVWDLGASDQTGGGGGLVLTASFATVAVGRINFMNSGNLTRVSVQARVAASGQTLVIRIMRATAAQQTGSPPCPVGDSIFPLHSPPMDSDNLVLPADQCTTSQQITFVTTPYPIVGMDTFTTASPPVAILPDVFTIQAKYTATTGTLVNAQDVIVTLFEQFT